MENEKNNQGFDQWFQELEAQAKPEPASAPQPESTQPAPANESGMAELSMSELSELELERIIQEAMSEEWDMALTEPTPEPEPEADGFLDDAYSDTPEGAEPPYPVEEECDEDGNVPRKVRPKRKGGYGLFGLPHIASTAIWLGLALLIGISIGRLVWLCAADILAFGRPDRDVTITITEEDTLDSITQKLHENGLIKYPSIFKMYAQLAKVEEKGKISVGTFELNTLYDYHALVGGMSATSSYRETTDVIIPEGYTCAQIFALLEEKGVCSAKALEDYSIQSQFSSYWFLEDVPKGTKYCLEGFLYPDTYEFYTNDTPQRIFSKMLARFDEKFDEEMRAQIDTLNDTLAAMYKRHGLSQEYADAHKLTVREVVIIASIIEKESAHSGEVRTIASVIYNRLTNPYEYPTLDMDATIVYLLGGKAELTKDDLLIDDPYNTYLYEGLPPGSISNPGEFSLKGALNPSETNYHFYALDPNAETRQHRFFATYEEQDAFLKSLGY